MTVNIVPVTYSMATPGRPNRFCRNAISTASSSRALRPNGARSPTADNAMRSPAMDTARIASQVTRTALISFLRDVSSSRMKCLGVVLIERIACNECLQRRWATPGCPLQVDVTFQSTRDASATEHAPLYHFAPILSGSDGCPSLRADGCGNTHMRLARKCGGSQRHARYRLAGPRRSNHEPNRHPVQPADLFGAGRPTGPELPVPARTFTGSGRHVRARATRRNHLRRRLRGTGHAGAGGAGQLGSLAGRGRAATAPGSIARRTGSVARPVRDHRRTGVS